MSDGQSFQCWGHCLGMTQSVTHGPGHKMHSTRSGYCSINLVPAVANIRDHLVSQCSNMIRSRQIVSQDSGRIDPVFVRLLITVFCQDSQRKCELWKPLRTTSSLRAMTAKKLTMTKIDDKPWSWMRIRNIFIIGVKHNGKMSHCCVFSMYKIFPFWQQVVRVVDTLLFPWRGMRGEREASPGQTNIIYPSVTHRPLGIDHPFHNWLLTCYVQKYVVNISAETLALFKY